ncbi:hypothetical protein ILUMI_18181 [Ignelater luminosus]|uniref:Uncharacterized protein n=1 Tax=Ignelater luminosus TaxID=2038154 RepID=A0A8K0CPM4_IGNLU|nr:hypothetical protein ILUMI_18181 [Ignelater luminosus]
MMKDDVIETDTITLLPPNNACGNITDKASGKENNVDMNNLPASQIQSPAEAYWKKKKRDMWYWNRLRNPHSKQHIERLKAYEKG